MLNFVSLSILPFYQSQSYHPTLTTTHTYYHIYHYYIHIHYYFHYYIHEPINYLVNYLINYNIYYYTVHLRVTLPFIIMSHNSTYTEDSGNLMNLADAALGVQKQKEEEEAKVAAAKTLVKLNHVWRDTVLIRPQAPQTVSTEAPETAPKVKKQRTKLPLAPSERRPQSSEPATKSKAATKYSAVSQNTSPPERANETETEAETTRADAAVPQDTPDDGKKLCECMKCKPRPEHPGKRLAPKTWAEHKRASDRHKAGEAVKDRCTKCTKADQPCVVRVAGEPCSACTWINEKCERNGAVSQRKRNHGDGTHPAKAPRSGKRKALEPTEGPKKARKLDNAGEPSWSKHPSGWTPINC